MGPKMAEKNEREFTEEQLRAHEGHIGLQAGFNKGASQAGVGAFGNTRHMWNGHSSLVVLIVDIRRFVKEIISLFWFVGRTIFKSQLIVWRIFINRSSISHPRLWLDDVLHIWIGFVFDWHSLFGFLSLSANSNLSQLNLEDILTQFLLTFIFSLQFENQTQIYFDYAADVILTQQPTTSYYV